ncbi:MAG: hypothetical protein JST84_11390 [Acidobacteria bacterium]|nr:hypothetical protein [Acidobacteriota bacterium]
MLDAATRVSKWRLTYIAALLSVIAGLSSYGWYIYTLVRDAQLHKPQPQIEKLLKDLLMYYRQTKQFPRNFTEINQRLWHTVPPPDYGKDGREARTKNYFYWYTQVNADTCAFWALPTGPQRGYASAFFIVLAPGWARAWKGKARSDEELNRLPAIPSPQALAEINMQELPARVFTATSQSVP